MLHGKFVLIVWGTGTCVFSHSQVVKDQAYIARELSHFLCDVARSFGLDDANGETAQPGNVFRAMASAYAAAVFVIVPIDNVMATVFDAPVATVGGKNALSVGLLGGSAGDAVGDFAGAISGAISGRYPGRSKLINLFRDDIRDVVNL